MPALLLGVSRWLRSRTGVVIPPRVEMNHGPVCHVELMDNRHINPVEASRYLNCWYSHDLMPRLEGVKGRDFHLAL